MIYASKALYDNVRMQLRGCSTTGEKKSRRTILKWVRRTISLYLCQPLPETAVGQHCKKIPWPLTIPSW